MDRAAIVDRVAAQGRMVRAGAAVAVGDAGCGSCIDACPQSAIELQDGVAVVDENACDGCGACAGECPNEAIALV